MVEQIADAQSHKRGVVYCRALVDVVLTRSKRPVIAKIGARALHRNQSSHVGCRATAQFFLHLEQCDPCSFDIIEHAIRSVAKCGAPLGRA
jgi:hypothetical protein